MTTPQRTREEIEEYSVRLDSRVSTNIRTETRVEAILETLLDIRDLLQELNKK